MNKRFLIGVVALIIGSIVLYLLWQLHPVAAIIAIIAGVVVAIRQTREFHKLSNLRSAPPPQNFPQSAAPQPLPAVKPAATPDKIVETDIEDLLQLSRIEGGEAPPPPPPASMTPAKPITPPSEQRQEAKPLPSRPQRKQSSSGSQAPRHRDLEIPEPEFERSAPEEIDDEAEADEYMKEAQAELAPMATFFTAYYARESIAEQTQGLYVYAHLQDALQQIAQDARQFVDKLGGNVPRPAAASQSTALAVGTALTVMPEADGLEFDPVAVTRKWQPPFTRFDFSYRAPQRLVGEIVTGRIAILVAGIEIAHIKFATMIEEAAYSADPVNLPANPLAAAKLAQTDPTPPYNRIFVSYSRKDRVVAENYRLAQMAAGNEVFMDTYSIRAGEDWRVALANAIDSADIFQLFWSTHSATSENVRDEWDYALQYRCPQDRCADFIRPVFWNDPMPAPPQELSHLNFRRVPFQTDTTEP